MSYKSPFLIIFFFAFSYRFLYYLSCFLKICHYKKLYQQYLNGKYNSFSIYTAPIKKLFKQAEVKDAAIPVIEPVGFGYIQTSTTSVIENITVKRTDIISSFTRMLLQAQGTFRMHLLECFSPLYWIQLIFFFPLKACSYLGISEEKAISKLFQIIYWITAPLLLVFRSQLYQFIVQLLQQAQ